MDSIPRLTTVLVCFALAAGFALSAFPAVSAGLGGSYIQGYVKNNAGTPLANVQVRMCSAGDFTCEPGLYTVRTDYRGFYSIEWGSGGTFIVWANKDRAYNYFEERQNATLPGGSGSRVRADFQLPDNVFSPQATLVEMFMTQNTAQFKVTMKFHIGSGTKTRVYAYNFPGSYTEITDVGGYTDVSICTCDNPGATSLVLKRGVIVHGIFWLSDYTHPSLFVLAGTTAFDTYVTYRDPMATPPGSGTEPWGFDPGVEVTRSRYDYKSTAAGVEFDVSGSVGILGVGVSFRLASFLWEQSGSNDRAWTFTIKNLGTVKHWIAFYNEGAISHIWQTS